MDRRRSPRFKTKFDALYSAAAEEGAGTLAEISYSGARLEGASIRPGVGTRIRLYIFLQPVAPFELEGLVARHTESGFALNYDLFDEDIRRLVDDVSALIATPSD